MNQRYAQTCFNNKFKKRSMYAKQMAYKKLSEIRGKVRTSGVVIGAW